MGYKLSATFFSPNGNCELYYLNGFRSGKPVLVGRSKAKTYKTAKGAWASHCKWVEYYGANVNVKFYIDKVN